jgi:hypothetical protein
LLVVGYRSYWIDFPEIGFTCHLLRFMWSLLRFRSPLRIHHRCEISRTFLDETAVGGAMANSGLGDVPLSTP